LSLGVNDSAYETVYICWYWYLVVLVVSSGFLKVLL